MIYFFICLSVIFIVLYLAIGYDNPEPVERTEKNKYSNNSIKDKKEFIENIGARNANIENKHAIQEEEKTDDSSNKSSSNRSISQNKYKSLDNLNYIGSLPKLTKNFSKGTINNVRNVKKHNYYMIKNAEEFRKKLIEEATDAEKKLIFKLNNSVYKNEYEFQKIIYIFNEKNSHIIDKFYIMDFYFRKYKIDLELDGGYHYVNEQKYKDDIRANDIFKNSHIKTIRLDNSYINNANIIGIIDKKIKNLIIRN